MLLQLIDDPDDLSSTVVRIVNLLDIYDLFTPFSGINSH